MKPSLFEIKKYLLLKGDKTMGTENRQHEQWQPVKGYEGIYLVSNWGNIRTVTRIIRGKHNGTRTIYGQTIKPIKTKAGYLHVYLAKGGTQKWEYVHTLVAQAFIANPDDKQRVSHINGDRTDNYVENLIWTSCSEIFTGRKYTQLTDEQLRQRKQEYQRKYYQSHKQEYIDRAKAYYYAHKEHCLQLMKVLREDKKRIQTAVWA